MKQYKAEGTFIVDADTHEQVCAIVPTFASSKLCRKIAKFAVEKLNQEERGKEAARKVVV